MSNFSFLQNEFSSLANESIKSESNIIDDPEVSAIYARKALEKTVKFIYKIDEDLDERLLERTELFALITHCDFADILPDEFIEEFPIIFPPLDLQNTFANKIEKIEEQKTLYELELEKLQYNFDALLAKSFQG